jgi:hypothetical protein
MAYRPFTVFVFLSGISALSTIVVVGFAAPPLSSSNGHSSSCRSTRTTLGYVAETNYYDEQYHCSRPHDVTKVFDVEVEGNSQFVYIPLHEMEDAVNKAQEIHEQDCASMQNTIKEQREELKRLKERNQKSDSADRMQYDHLAENAEAIWGENHEEKMKRTTDRVRYLTNENERLQSELDEERARFESEKGRLQQKFDEARDETAEAHKVLSFERSYFETAIKLLEVGLEREMNNVKALEDQLLQYNELGHHNNHHQPFHDDLPPFETWEASGAFEQRQGDHDHEDHHYPFEHGEVFEEFQPQVSRPQEMDHHYHQDSRIHSRHGPGAQEPHSFYRQHNGQTNQQHSYTRSNTNTATTTVMGASSIRDNLGINDIRDPMYR